jgi:hypothetical protein
MQRGKAALPGLLPRPTCSLICSFSACSCFSSRSKPAAFWVMTRSCAASSASSTLALPRAALTGRDDGAGLAAAAAPAPA